MCIRDSSNAVWNCVWTSRSLRRSHLLACLTLPQRSTSMDYIRLGSTGLTVSRLALGCMSYGVPDRGEHPWTLDEATSRPYIRQAVELGFNFFDTSNSYSD